MIAEFESRILTLIDNIVEHTSDDGLFASGYLHGYLAPAMARLDAGEGHSAEASYVNVTSSLEKAIGADELLPRNQALMKEMWDTLFQKATQQ